MSFVKHKQISVFISSDMRELEYDRQIAEQALKDMNLNPILFEVFPAMSYSPNVSCREEVRDCDIFLMLLWKSFTSNVEEEYIEAVKHNKPILILVKSLLKDEKHEQKLEKLLKELSSDSQKHPHQSPRLIYKTYRKVQELRTEVLESVAVEIAKFYKEPVYTMARDEMYELGTSIIQYAQRRLYLFQRTPSLILGARDYLVDDSMKYVYEKKFADVLTEWINVNYKLSDKEFLYLFSPKATEQEIRDKQLGKNANYLSDVKKRVRWLKKIESKSCHRFRIDMLDVPVSGPLIVGDNRYAIWILGKDQAVSISQENKGMCDILVRILNSYGQEYMSAEEILSALRL